jgi:2-polyprenyl-3-methyl-5-hydroxy-6-metoxy-1,4-benzoquinol methylase
VHEVAAQPGRRTREHELLAADPVEPVGRAHRQDDAVDAEIGAGGVATHEGREPDIRRGPSQLRDERARGHLHAAGLARHEEDEVEPDVAHAAQDATTTRVYNPGEQWERFGATDPYYGVYSVDAYRQENLDADARRTFFASGEEHVDTVLATVRRLARPDFAPRSVLDHGCGVGRLVVPFAGRAERVVGVDVAPSMLAEARRNCAERGLHNVELVTADRLAGLAPEFDLVHSFIVLQHIPQRQGLEVFERLTALVAPGGVGYVHVPIASPGLLARAHTAVTRTVPYAYNVVNVLRGRPWSYPHMQMNVYRLNALASRLVRQGFDVLHTAFDRGTGSGGYVSATLVFARGESARS